MKFNKISIEHIYIFFLFFDFFFYIFFEINNSTSSSTRITSPLKPYYFVLAQSVTVSLFLLSRCISPSLKPKTSSLSPPPPFPATQKWRPVLCSHPLSPLTVTRHSQRPCRARTLLSQPSRPRPLSISGFTEGHRHCLPSPLPLFTRKAAATAPLRDYRKVILFFRLL
jgi:hypothetical protein